MARGLQWLTTPAEAVLAARGSTMTFRNRQSLRQVRLDYKDRIAPRRAEERNRPDDRPEFVESITFEVDSDTSLNWYLPGRELDEMRAKFREETARKALAAVVAAWWR